MKHISPHISEIYQPEPQNLCCASTRNCILNKVTDLIFLTEDDVAFSFHLCLTGECLRHTASHRRFHFAPFFFPCSPKTARNLIFHHNLSITYKLMLDLYQIDINMLQF